MVEKLSADEALWKQNQTYSMPVTSTKRHELDFSDFSGIIGPVDLSTAYVFSCTLYSLILLQYMTKQCLIIADLAVEEKYLLANISIIKVMT